MMMPNAGKCAVRLTLMFVTEKNIIDSTFSEQCLPQSRHSIYILVKRINEHVYENMLLLLPYITFLRLP